VRSARHAIERDFAFERFVSQGLSISAAAGAGVQHCREHDMNSLSADPD
jgi:hypothetical protein